jgi:ribonuclease T1
MKTNVVRTLAAWLLALAIAAAGTLGCKDSSPGTSPAAPPGAAGEQEALQAEGKAPRADKKRGDRDPSLSLQLPAGVPAKVGMVLKYIDGHNRPPEGYEGGRMFGSFEGLLPKKDARGRPLKYQEWDVNPKVTGKNRGPERLVTGSDGSAYYTADHYKSFIKIR